MNIRTLGGARVSPRQVLHVSHTLAAANHRQWCRWEEWVLRNPSLLAQGVDAVRKAGGTKLKDELANSARDVIDIVDRAVGGFAYMPDQRIVVRRKQDQFASWVRYAAGQHNSRRERWLLQCRTPFLNLPPDMQASDYTEAARDLKVVAEAGGLVLCSPLPEMTPLPERQLRRMRMTHAMGVHGQFVGSEQPWSNICTGCHRSWSSTH